MRLFFSVPLPDEARAAAGAAVRAMKRAAGDAPLSWTKDDQLHFTLAFLGERKEADLPQLSEVLSSCAATPSFELTLSGAGAFPNPRRPRILWLGAGQGGSELTHLAALLAERLRAAGFALEERPFHAHLTVARVKPGGERGASRALGASPRGELARMRVDRLFLMQSQLSPQGARHTVVEEIRLT